MMKNILKDVQMPEVFWWDVPTWDKDKACQVTTSFPFLLPHEMLHHLVDQYALDDLLLNLDSTYGPFTRDVMTKAGLSME